MDGEEKEDTVLVLMLLWKGHPWGCKEGGGPLPAQHTKR